VDVEEIKRSFPTYVLDAEYLTKLKNENPDAKALDIEAMLAAELKIRTGVDEDFIPLSERLKHVVVQKRNGTLAGIALISELEKLTKEMLAMIEETKRPLRESLAKAAIERSLGLKEDLALEVANALLLKADALCYEGWHQHDHMDTELYRESTILLAQKYRHLRLHGKGTDFVDRSVKLLKRVRYKSQTQPPKA
jgi:type I restriction enzyme R subunit